MMFISHVRLTNHSQHQETYASFLFLMCGYRNRGSSVVIHVVMELAISRAKSQSLKKMGVIIEGKRVEDIKPSL